jgi:bacteriorhodopsin
MADIDVVPKRRTSTWLWVMLAVVVLAILWMALGSRSAPRTSHNERISSSGLTLVLELPGHLTLA